MTVNLCACGCGDAIDQVGASYAGTDDQARAKHRARAAYRRKVGGTVDGTQEAMAALGLADDVPVAKLAERMASVAAELSRRVAGMDSVAVARQIEASTAAARQRADEAEDTARRSMDAQAALSEQVAAAVERADLADSDALKASERAEALVKMLNETEERAQSAYRASIEARQLHQDADRARERAETLLIEVRGQVEQVRTDAAQRHAAQLAQALAEQRAGTSDALAELRAEVVQLRAQLAAAHVAGVPADEAPAAPVKTPRRRTTKAAVAPETPQN
jgi:chromosome segregation ATPase